MDQYLEMLFNSKDKRVIVNEKFTIINVTPNNELLSLDLRFDNIVYKDIKIEDGIIFPTPQKNNIFLMKELSFQLDKLNYFILLAKGEISENLNDKKIIPQEEPQQTVSFDEKNIISSLKSILHLNNIDAINSNIFRIQKNEGNIIYIKSIKDNLDYQLFNNELIQDNEIEKGKFLWIYFYEIEKNIIKTNKITMIEIIKNSQRLIELVDLILSENPDELNLFKVLYVNANDVILINNDEKLCKINKVQDIFEPFDIQICEIFVISKYGFIEGEDIPMLKLDKDSFIYLTKQETYFNMYYNIPVLSFSAIKFTFLDFNENINFYDTICVNNICTLKIAKKEEYLTLSGLNNRYQEVIPTRITLSDSKKIHKAKTFYILIYKGLLNWINAFINIEIPYSFFYEFFYYRLDKELEDIEKKIIIQIENSQAMEYTIKNYDSFSSKNRKRINIMNIPYQEDIIEENELQKNGINSIQIIELRKNNVSKVVGIHEISTKELFNSLDNNVFDKYYDDFGNIFDKIVSNYKLTDIVDFISKYEKYKGPLNFDDSDDYRENMSLRQYKTRIGLLISRELSNYKTNASKISEIISQMENLKEIFDKKTLNYYQKIRLIDFTLNYLIKKNVTKFYKLMFFSDMEPDTPYFLALRKNLTEINELNEFSETFPCFLQLDSYICNNLIHEKESYTFSLEPLFVMKNQLFSMYEDFFYTKQFKDEEYAFFYDVDKITVINEAEIFGENHENISLIKGSKARDCAFAISNSFRHEKNGHKKIRSKNRRKNSPILYYKGLKTLIVPNIKTTKNPDRSFIKGESGEMVEKYIFGNRMTHNQLYEPIHGNLLNINNLTEKNFDISNESIKRNENNKNNNSNENDSKKKNVDSQLKKISQDDDGNCCNYRNILKEQKTIYNQENWNLLISILKKKREYLLNRRKNKKK